MQKSAQRSLFGKICPVIPFICLVGCISPGNMPVSDLAANVPSTNNNPASAKKPAEGHLSREEVEGVIRSKLPQIDATIRRRNSALLNRSSNGNFPVLAVEAKSASKRN